MSIRTAIRSLIINDPTAGPIIGSSRCYDRRAPQTPTFPFCVFQVLGGFPIDNISGGANLYRVRIQVSCFANGDTAADTAETLAEAIEAKLKGYSGTVAGVKIRGIYLEEVEDALEGEIKNYKSIRRFGVWYKKS